MFNKFLSLFGRKKIESVSKSRVSTIELSLSRLKTMRTAHEEQDNCQCGVCDSCTKRSLVLPEQNSEKIGRKYWANSAEPFDPDAEREAAAAETRAQKVIADRDLLIDPLARAEFEWQRANRKPSVEEDEQWLSDYAKSKERSKEQPTE